MKTSKADSPYKALANKKILNLVANSQRLAAIELLALVYGETYHGGLDGNTVMSPAFVANSMA